MASKSSRHEIDKETMYKKLMPSARHSAPTSMASQSEQKPAAIQPAFVQSDASPRREVRVPDFQTQNYALVNEMEALVLEKLEDALTRMKCCRCDRCKKDIVALALNKLPPRYRVVQEKQPERQADTDLNAQIVTAVIQAILTVRSKPRH